MTQTPKEVRVMQVVFGLLAVQFILPSLSYFFTPELAVTQAQTLGMLLGGGAYPAMAGETGYLFRVLAAGNVFTLGVLCLLMLRDIRRNQPLIPVFVVLKGFSALGYLYVYAVQLHYPLFLLAFFWDALAVSLVVGLGTRAYRAVIRQAAAAAIIP